MAKATSSGTLEAGVGVGVGGIADSSAVNSEQLDMLEEDDEFEEFDTEKWTPGEEEPEDMKLWGENWDDEDVDETFVEQLRNEIKRQVSASEKPSN